MVRVPIFLALSALAVGRIASAPSPSPAAPGAQDTLVARGQKLFASICRDCHTLAPPPDKAPPMTHVARHYAQAFPVPAERIERIGTWIAEPDTARSLLPARARVGWGLMPPLLLPAEDRVAAAHYVSSLAAADTVRGGQSGMGMRGMGRGGMGMHRRGGEAGTRGRRGPGWGSSPGRGEGP